MIFHDFHPGRVVCGSSSVADPQRPGWLRGSTADANPPWRSWGSPVPGSCLASSGRCAEGSTYGPGWGWGWGWADGLGMEVPCGAAMGIAETRDEDGQVMVKTPGTEVWDGE